MTLLKKLNSVKIEGIKKFVAAKHFVDGQGFWLGSDFKTHFLPKTEPAIKAQKIRVSELTENANDGRITAELGQDYTITLGQLFELLKSADKQRWFIAYVADVSGTVWAVSCYWYAGNGWGVAANALSHPDVWHAGRQVFSRERPLTLVVSNSDPLILLNSEDEDLRGSKEWSTASGYAKKGNAFVHRLVMERKIGGAIPLGIMVDHVNRNKLDNRRENLRLATNGQNQVNSLGNKTNSTGFRGVYLYKDGRTKGKPYRAMLTLNQEKIYIGMFATAEEAARAYDDKALELFEEFALLNFPKEPSDALLDERYQAGRTDMAKDIYEVIKADLEGK